MEEITIKVIEKLKGAIIKDFKVLQNESKGINNALVYFYLNAVITTADILCNDLTNEILNLTQVLKKEYIKHE